MVLVTELPAELLQQILGYVHLKDLGRLLRTCKHLHVFVAGNRTLHRAIYYRELDPPPTDDLDWEKELHDLVGLQVVCSPHRTIHQKKSDLPFVHDTATRLLRHATSGSVDANDVNEYTLWFDDKEARLRWDRDAMYGRSRNVGLLAALLGSDANREAFLSQSFMFERAPGHSLTKRFRDPPRPENQMSAKLDSLFGLPMPPRVSHKALSRNVGPQPAGDGGDGGGGGQASHLHYLHHHHHHHYHHGHPAPGTSGGGGGGGDGAPDLAIQLRSATAKHQARRRRLKYMYPFACSKVYDLRHYTRATRWGPFMADGSDRVDWEMVEAILFVLRKNLAEQGLDDSALFSSIWNEPLAGTWPNSYCSTPCTAPLPFATSSGKNSTAGHGADTAGRDERGESSRSLSWAAAAAFAAPHEEDEEAGAVRQAVRDDPYGVSGVWLRPLCFLDYSDFFDYNFPDGGDQLPPNVPRPALDVEEALRIVVARIRATRIEWPEAGSGRVSNSDVGQVAPGYPVVHFSGTAGMLDMDASSRSELKGFAYMTPEGEVRWTTISIFQGQERWKSEGVQLGGIRSARGVVGTWFEKNFDPHGPCGPTAYWKIGDYDSSTETEAFERVTRRIVLRAADGLNANITARGLDTTRPLPGWGYVDEDDDDDDDYDDDVFDSDYEDDEHHDDSSDDMDEDDEEDMSARVDPAPPADTLLPSRGCGTPGETSSSEARDEDKDSIVAGLLAGDEDEMDTTGNRHDEDGNGDEEDRPAHSTGYDGDLIFQAD